MLELGWLTVAALWAVLMWVALREWRALRAERSAKLERAGLGALQRGNDGLSRVG